MATVTALAGHLLTLLQPALKPDLKSPVMQSVGEPEAARLAFYHFLKNLCEPGEPLTSNVLERFFRRSLTHAHWNENKLSLFAEVSACLQHFSNQHNEPLPMAPFESAYGLQVLKAESFRTLERVVEDWLQQNHGPTDQVRILKDREERIIVVRLSIDRTVVVNVFDRHLAIRDGRLEPLADDMALHYGPDLRLDPSRVSQIEIAPHTIARFRESPTGASGNVVRGFTFQKTLSLDGCDIHKTAILFYPIKRIEQFFVRKESDPLYVELTGLLEKASDLLAQKHPEAPRFAEAAMERGRLAFEQVFVDDRLLRLLLENLERALKLSHLSGQTQSDRRREMTMEAGISQTELAKKPGIGSIPVSHLGLNLPAGAEFVDSVGFEEDQMGEFALGPDLVELQESERCETLSPLNQTKPVPRPTL